MTGPLIRNERESDYPIVESLTRDAFWNLNVPGCDEHYLAHIMREHEDFLPELDFVLELDGRIVGNIMYTRAKLVNEAGAEKPVLTFGPLSIRPEWQRRGYGKRLIAHSLAQAAAHGHEAVVIFGDPANYVSSGFKSGKRFGVCLEGDIYPAALLVKELRPGALDGGKWVYHESPVYRVDGERARAFDERFEARERLYRPSQEVFYIQSHSLIQR